MFPDLSELLTMNHQSNALPKSNKQSEFSLQTLSFLSKYANHTHRKDNPFNSIMNKTMKNSGELDRNNTTDFILVNKEQNRWQAGCFLKIF